MTQIQAAFAQRLQPGEDLIAVVEDLTFVFITHATPDRNLDPKLNGAMALTTHRIIIGWAETQQGLKWLHIPALNSVSERSLRADKPDWPFQAIMSVPGGMAVVVQTEKADEKHGEQLSALLNKAIFRLGASFRGDDSAALIAYEDEQQEEQKRREARDKRPGSMD
jgi:hypothetical protein